MADEFDQYKRAATPAPSSDDFSQFKRNRDTLTGRDPNQKSQPITKDDLINLARPGIADAAIEAGGTLIGGPVGTGAGFLTAGLLDRLAQHLENKPPQGVTSQSLGLEPGSFPSDTANTGEMLLGNYLFGKAAGAVARPFVNAFHANQIVDPSLSKLEPTFSQYLDPNSKLGKVSQFLEDTFARNRKNAAIQNSANLAQTAADAQFKTISGRSTSILTNPQVHSDLIRMGIQSNLDDLNDAFNQHMTEAQYYKPQYAINRTVLRPGQNPVTPLIQTNPNFDPIKYTTAIKNAAAVKALTEPYEMGDSLQQLLNKSHVDSIPFVDNILNDSKVLDRTLKTGNIKIPGTNNVTMDTTRDDLRGYYLNKLIDNVSKQDPITGKTVALNPQSLMDQFKDQQTKESTRLLFNGANMSNIQQLFKNIAFTQQKQLAGLSTAAKIYYGASGLEMAGSLLGGDIRFGMIPAAIHLNGWALGRLMTDPKIARIMIAAGSGTPLGVSQKFAADMIGKALNGVALDVIDRNGKQVRGQINNGEFIPSQEQPGQTPVAPQ